MSDRAGTVSAVVKVLHVREERIPDWAGTKFAIVKVLYVWEERTPD